jgi:acyl-CoA thioester hydrolase
MDEWHETGVRVRYAETDQMGIAHHANYLIWFEAGRSDLCRARGFSYKQMEDEDDAFLVVAESYCRYKQPAHYDDDLVIRTKIGELRSRSIRFVYEVVRKADDELLAEGETLHLVTGRDKKVRSLPDVYRNRLLGQHQQAFPAHKPPS